MSSKTKITTIATMLAIITVPLFAENVQAADDDVVLADGTILLSSITARTITVPVTAKVTYGADIELIASEATYVYGQLAGAADEGSGVRAYDVTIKGPRIEIYGSIKSASGRDSSDGATGGRGGNIALAVPSLGTLTIASGAYIRAGDGGRAATIAGMASAVAGDGGAGGQINIQTPAASIAGDLFGGSGGAGGNVRVGGNSSGGAGGPGGDIAVASPSFLLTGKAWGGKGGDGGHAVSAPTSFDNQTAVAGEGGRAGTYKLNGQPIAISGTRPQAGTSSVAQDDVGLSTDCSAQGSPGQFNALGNGGNGGTGCISALGAYGLRGAEGACGINGGRGTDGSSIWVDDAIGGDGGHSLLYRGGSGGHATLSAQAFRGGQGGSGGVIGGTGCSHGGPGGNGGSVTAGSSRGGTGGNSCLGSRGDGGTAAISVIAGPAGSGGPALVPYSFGPTGAPGGYAYGGAYSGAPGLGGGSSCLYG